MSWTAIFAPMLWLSRLRVMVTLGIFVAAAYLMIAFNWSYSDGNRAGYIQKFSKKGWLCKTYEGELAMTTVPGVAPVLWEFSIWDKQVADDLSRVMGKRVILHYKEYRYLPTTCFGETDYFVDRVEVQELP
ncbi:MAG: hypothetical protein EWM72_00171 [Nitrospira sp.]|nr:MAG: hypothetical protein EWM72_00171 [Nitrospira sp.]